MVSQVSYRAINLVSSDGSVSITDLANGDTNLQTSGGGAAGSTTQVQYNSSGAFAGNANFVYDSGTNTVTFGNITGSALAMTIQPKAPTVLEAGGTLTLQARAGGASTRAGGAVVIAAGAGISATGGAVTISSGAATGSGLGGTFTVNVGASTGGSNGSAFTVNGAAAAAVGGALTFNGGTSSGSTGGALNFNGGAGVGLGGTLNFTSGTSSGGSSGNINFTTPTSAADSGSMFFKTSAVNNLGGLSGAVQLSTGNTTKGSSVTGVVDFRSGNAGGAVGEGTSDAGGVSFTAGNSVAADGGNGGILSFTSGNGSQAGFSAGSMLFTFGNDTAGADPARLVIAKTLGSFGAATAANAVALGVTGPVAGLTVTKWLPVTLDGVNGYIPFFS